MHPSSAPHAAALAGVLALAGCAGRGPVADRPTAPAGPTLARVLAAAGVPAPLAAVRLGATYAEVRAARPASQHSLGLGRFDELAGWTAHYRFDAPPAGPDVPLEEVTRREPGPGQPMLRAEFGRPVPADSAEARWAVAAARAQGAAGAAARCARFAVPGWGPERPVDRQGAVAYVPLPGRSGAPRARVAVAYAVSVADAGAPSGGAAARPPHAGLTVGAEPVPEDDVVATLETEAVPCPAPVGPAGAAAATRPDA